MTLYNVYVFLFNHCDCYNCKYQQNVHSVSCNIVVESQVVTVTHKEFTLLAKNYDRNTILRQKTISESRS